MKETRRYLVCLALIWCPGIVSTVWAQALFDEPRTFVLAEACSAYASIKKQTEPVSLDVARAYRALGENRPEGASHALIDVNDRRKWVALSCGSYQGQGQGHGGSEGTSPDPDCLPFFDNQHNPVSLPGSGRVDVTPPAPDIAPFGHAVNGLCGEFGTKVTPAGFSSMLAAHPDLLERVREFTKGRVFAGHSLPTGAGGYLRDLTDAWFGAGGFAHIFCGEPGRSASVGGLHFRGRYLQLQREGVACRLPDNRRSEEVEPGTIYSMGVRIRTNAATLQSERKGYGLTLSAEDLLKVVTRAFAENPASGRSNEGCLLAVQDDGKRFKAVFVRRKQGIRTFYPDATPDTGRNSACAAKIALPRKMASNRLPLVVSPLGRRSAPVGELTEVAVPKDSFSDPEGKELRLAVAPAGGREWPDWADYDANNSTLLFLPGGRPSGYQPAHFSHGERWSPFGQRRAVGGGSREEVALGNALEVCTATGNVASRSAAAGSRTTPGVSARSRLWFAWSTRRRRANTSGSR